MELDVEQNEKNLNPKDTQEEDLPTAAADESKAKKSGKGASFLAVLAILISGAAGAAAVFLYQSQQVLVQKITGVTSNFDSTANNLRAELTTNQQRLEKRLARLQEETLDLKRNISQLYSREAGPTKALNTNEIRHLLQLASVQLALAENIDSAIAALRLADRRIAESGDPALQSIRKQIASDLASLEQVERIDLAGTVSRLQAVEQSIDKLPLAGHQKAYTASKTASAAAGGEQPTFWSQMLDDISSMVKIQRIDQPVMPLLPPDQQYLLRENIKTNILAARISLLRGDSRAYAESLDQARKLTRKYFTVDDSSTQWILKEIDSLASLNPSPPLPDISGSLASLEQLLEERK